MSDVAGRGCHPIAGWAFLALCGGCADENVIADGSVTPRIKGSNVNMFYFARSTFNFDEP